MTMGIAVAPLPGWKYKQANYLSYRECEVLAGVAQGRTSKEIGTDLCIAGKTVDNHVATICNKLGVDNRISAVMQGIYQGIISLADEGKIIIGRHEVQEPPQDLVMRLEAVIARSERESYGGREEK